MNVQVQAIQLTDWLKYEEEGQMRLSRAEVTIASADVDAGIAKCGQLIGAKADGTLAHWTPDVPGSAVTLVGILVNDVTKGVKGAAVVRKAVVSAEALVAEFGAGRFTLAQLESGLSALGILTRKSV